MWWWCAQMPGFRKRGGTARSCPFQEQAFSLFHVGSARSGCLETCRVTDDDEGAGPKSKRRCIIRSIDFTPGSCGSGAERLDRSIDWSVGRGSIVMTCWMRHTRCLRGPGEKGGAPCRPPRIAKTRGGEHAFEVYVFLALAFAAAAAVCQTHT